jgi:hypothetical protein
MDPRPFPNSCRSLEAALLVTDRAQMLARAQRGLLSEISNRRGQIQSNGGLSGQHSIIVKQITVSTDSRSSKDG